MTTPLCAAGLLGRQAELAGLTSLLEGPGGGAMVVLGEAGSGKTALLEAAAALAEEREVRVLRVTGYGAESRYPFAGLHQLLLPVLDELARVSNAPGRVLSRVFGLNVQMLELPGNAARPTDAGSRAEGPSIAEVGDACLRLLRYLNSRQRTGHNLELAPGTARDPTCSMLGRRPMRAGTLGRWRPIAVLTPTSHGRRTRIPRLRSFSVRPTGTST